MVSRPAWRLGLATACLGAVALAALAGAERAADAPPAAGPGPRTPGVVSSEFIYEESPFPSAHASTIAESTNGLVAAWFGGSDEGEADVGIWLSRKDATEWTAPVEVATGVSETGRRHPCWNPVLFQQPDGPLQLFYKVGPSPREWWGMLITSADGGKTWSRPTRLPPNFLGPIKNKPILLRDGTLLCGSSTEHDGWRIHMERMTEGRNWDQTPPLNDPRELAAIQPTILTHSINGARRLQILCRTRQFRIAESWSDDEGKTWSPLALTNLPNPNSGIDAVSLKDGRAVLIYNHTRFDRSPLNVAVSDDGRAWKAGPVLESEPGEYSYPAVIQASDGKVHVTYTWRRKRIRHVVLDPAQIALTDLPAAR